MADQNPPITHNWVTPASCLQVSVDPKQKSQTYKIILYVRIQQLWSLLRLWRELDQCPSQKIIHCSEQKNQEFISICLWPWDVLQDYQLGCQGLPQLPAKTWYPSHMSISNIWSNKSTMDGPRGGHRRAQAIAAFATLVPGPCQSTRKERQISDAERTGKQKCCQKQPLPAPENVGPFVTHSTTHIGDPSTPWPVDSTDQLGPQPPRAHQRAVY